jgi:hypothetical protein
MDNPGDDLIPLNPQDTSISQKIRKFVADKNLSYISESVLSQKLFGIESDFVEQNPLCVREYKEGDYYDEQKELKILANDKAGAAGRAKWYIVDKSFILQGIQYIHKWKVVVSSAHPGGQDNRSNQLQILDNFSVFGRARVALKTFDTEEEARNFYSYIDSKFIRFAFLLTDEALTSLAKLVPDIINYNSGNGIIDFGNDVDEQLFKLLGITEKEIEYIYSVVSNK